MKAHLRGKAQAKKVAAVMSQAVALQGRGDLLQALSLCAQALLFDSRHFDALNLAGAIAYQLKQYAIAEDFLRKALEASPSDARAHCNLGLVLCQVNSLDTSLVHFQKAISLRPDWAEPYANMAQALGMLRRYEEAILCYDRAISLQSAAANLYGYRGQFKTEVGAYADAANDFDLAIELNADLVDVHWNRSLNWLRQGLYAQGWTEYEWRWRRAETRPFSEDLGLPLWMGKESLAGKTILIHCEQGLGDTLQFCRYLAAIKVQGAKVVFVVQRCLRSLLEDLVGVDLLLSNGDPLPHCDYIVPLLSLPLIFGTKVNSIPAQPSYIKANSDRLAKWQAQIGPKTAPRIGLVWRGNANHGNDFARSVNLADLVSSLPLGPQYVSLQKGMTPADRAALASRSDILDISDSLHDFADTAAVCTLTDVVVSVDTSVAHLAGALGHPVWILLPFNPDWRWLLDREDSPWYPSAKLYRQGQRDAWNDVFERIHADLAAMCNLRPKVCNQSPDKDFNGGKFVS